MKKWKKWTTILLGAAMVAGSIPTFQVDAMQANGNRQICLMPIKTYEDITLKRPSSADGQWKCLTEDDSFFSISYLDADEKETEQTFCIRCAKPYEAGRTVVHFGYENAEGNLERIQTYVVYKPARNHIVVLPMVSYETDSDKIPECGMGCWFNYNKGNPVFMSEQQIQVKVLLGGEDRVADIENHASDKTKEEEGQNFPYYFYELEPKEKGNATVVVDMWNERLGIREHYASYVSCAYEVTVDEQKNIQIMPKEYEKPFHEKSAYIHKATTGNVAYQWKAEVEDTEIAQIQCVDAFSFNINPGTGQDLFYEVKGVKPGVTYVQFYHTSDHFFSYEDVIENVWYRVVVDEDLSVQAKEVAYEEIAGEVKLPLKTSSPSDEATATPAVSESQTPAPTISPTSTTVVVTSAPAVSVTPQVVTAAPASETPKVTASASPSASPKATETATPKETSKVTETVTPKETLKVTETVAPGETPKATETTMPRETQKAVETARPVQATNVAASASPKGTDTTEVVSATKKIAKVTKVVVKMIKGKSAKIGWNKVRDIAGYEVCYATRADFKKAKIKRVSAKKVPVILRKLSGKTYYVRVRAYAKDANGNKQYGDYSSVRKVLMKQK